MNRSKKKDPHWIIIHDETKGLDAYAVECRHCGAKQRFATPISITVYAAAAKAFGRMHARCTKPRVPTGTDGHPPTG